LPSPLPARRRRVAHRGEAHVSPKFKTGELPTGEIEVRVTEFEVLSESPPPPLEISDYSTANEELRLESRWPGPGQRLPGLVQKPLAGVHADQHAARAEPAEDAPAEAAGAAAQLDHAVIGPQAQVVQELLGRLGEMGVLDGQPPGGPLQ